MPQSKRLIQNKMVAVYDMAENYISFKCLNYDVQNLIVLSVIVQNVLNQCGAVCTPCILGEELDLQLTPQPVQRAYCNILGDVL